MKRVLSGVRYDTDSAVLIGEASNPGASPKDPSRWSAGLYKSPRTRRFFLAGRGGGMTLWGGRSSGIIPLEEDDARGWATYYLRGSDWRAHFE